MISEAQRQWRIKNADRVRASRRKHALKAYRENPEKFLQRAKQWRANNKAAVRARDAVYRQKNAAKRREQFRRWRTKHKDYFRGKNRQMVVGLANWYVRQRLSRNSIVAPSSWPAPLVECKRAQMKVSRLCRNQKTLKS